LAEDVGVGAEGATWIEVSLADIDQRWGAFSADWVRSALFRGSKDCRNLNDDAKTVLKVLLAPHPSDPEAELCNSNVGGAADGGPNFIVEIDRGRPSELAALPTSSVRPLSEVSNQDAVIKALQTQITGR